MATTKLGWLIALLAATPAIYVACGGDDSSTTTSTGTAGTGGATGSGGSTGTGGTGGSGTGGAAGRAARRPAGGGGVPDGVMCGGMVCTTNPTGTNMRHGQQSLSTA